MNMSLLFFTKKTGRRVCATVLTFSIGVALMCGNNATGPVSSKPPVNSGQSFTLTTTQPSSIANIDRMPDKKTYARGDTVQVNALPSSGYTFDGWTGDTVSAEATLKVIMRKDMALLAGFTSTTNGKRYYSVADNSKNGSCYLSPAGGIYESGTVVTATARPDYGFTFSTWSEPRSTADSVITFEITKSTVLTALFAPDPAAVFVSVIIDPVPQNGTITFDPPGMPSGNSVKFKPGTTVTATAAPNTGYEFKEWSGAPEIAWDSRATTSWVIDSNVTLSAVFEKAPNGVTWTFSISGTLNGLLSAAAGNGIIVVVGNMGTILTSSDGVSWTPRVSNATSCLNSVIWNGSKFVAAGDLGIIVTSVDGMTWTLQDSKTTQSLQSIVWNGQKFVAVGGKFINSGYCTTVVISSADGVTWKEEYTGSGIWFCAAWNGQIFVAGGYEYDFTTQADFSMYELNTSRDGKTWESVGSNIAQHTCFTSIVFGAGKFVAVGGSRRTGDPFSSIYISTNGTDWSKEWAPTSSTLNGVTWTGNNFVTVGKNGVVLTADSSAKTWQLRPTGITDDFFGVAWTGSKVIAVGYGGLIMTAP